MTAAIVPVRQNGLYGALLELVFESEERRGVNLPEETEVYVAFVLQRYVSDLWPQTPLALAFIESARYISVGVDASKFLEIGDVALLRVAAQYGYLQKHNLSLDYFVGIGRDAYFGASLREYDTTLRDRDQQLSDGFPFIAGVLSDLFSRRSTDDETEVFRKLKAIMVEHAASMLVPSDAPLRLGVTQ